MTDVITQIWFGMLLAGIIGGITGWFFRGSGKKRFEELESNWQKRYQKLMQEKTSFQEKVEQLHVIKHERNALSNKLKQMHSATKRHTGLEARLSNLHQALNKKNQDFTEEQNNANLLNNKITKMQALMKEKDSMLHQITEKLAGMGALNKEKHQYVEQLESEVSDLQQRLTNSDKKVMANDAQIQKLMAEAEQNAAHHHSVERAAVDIEKLERSQSELVALRGELDAANIRIQEDQEKISRLVGELPQMAKQLISAQNEISVRDSELEALREVIDGNASKYQKIDARLDEHRVALLDANSKIQVLYEALDQEREKNQQVNADNKLKDYRLSEYLEDAENKALEIHALYQRLTSKEFDLIGIEHEGLNSASISNLLPHSDEVENDRQSLLHKCDLIESELAHYKTKLESKDQQLEVQKVVNRKLLEELDRIQSRVKEGDGGLLEESEVSVEPLSSEPNSIDSSHDVEQQVDLEGAGVESHELPEIDQAFIAIDQESIDAKGNQKPSEDKSLNTPPNLASTFVPEVAKELEDNGVESVNTVDMVDSLDSEGLASDPSSGLNQVSNNNTPLGSQQLEDIGGERVATLGWYGNEQPKINLLSYGSHSHSHYSNIGDQSGRSSLEKLDGMTDSKLSRLNANGIYSLSDLHQYAKNAKGKHAASELKIREDEWDQWESHADLLRIDGLNVNECRILNELKIFSVEDLSSVGVSELKGKIHQLKRKQKLAAAIGSNTVSSWVEGASALIRADVYR